MCALCVIRGLSSDLFRLIFRETVPSLTLAARCQFGARGQGRAYLKDIRQKTSTLAEDKRTTQRSVHCAHVSSSMSMITKCS